jgi:hypothetical protein
MTESGCLCLGRTCCHTTYRSLGLKDEKEAPSPVTWSLSGNVFHSLELKGRIKVTKDLLCTQTQQHSSSANRLVLNRFSTSQSMGPITLIKPLR